MFTSATSRASPLLLKQTHAVIEDGIARGLHLGAQVYVSHDGVPIAEIAIGHSRPGVALTTETLMAWFCCTKVPLIVAIAQLWERGHIDVADAVADHIPELAVAGKHRLKIRHILTHTTGFAPDSKGIAFCGLPWEEAVHAAAERPLVTAPGEKAAYSIGSTSFLLAEIVQRVTRRPLRAYLRDEVFGPLGITDSWLGMPAERYHNYGERICPMYFSGAAPMVADALLTDAAIICRCLPGTGGVGPMRELGRLLEALNPSDDVSPGPAGRVLSTETVSKLIRPWRVGMFDEGYGGQFDWGLGLIVDGRAFGPPCSPRTYGHTGQETSFVLADPEHGLVAAVAFNGLAGRWSVPRRHRVITALYEDLGLLETGAARAFDEALAEQRHRRPERRANARTPVVPALADFLPDLPDADDDELEAALESLGGQDAALRRCFRILSSAAHPRADITGVIEYELWSGAARRFAYSLIVEGGAVTFSSGRNGRRGRSADMPTLRLRLTVADFVRCCTGVLDGWRARRYGRVEMTGSLAFLDHVRFMFDAGTDDPIVPAALPGAVA
jgi:CubicO group peptidase (beta-lactamase class C family)